MAVFTAMVPHDVNEKYEYITVYIKTYADMCDEKVMGIHRVHLYVLYTVLAVTRLTKRKETGIPRELYCKYGED
jgi:hypothetical protein